MERNAFDVLMDAQRQLPDPIADPKTNKQRLMNNVISLFSDKDGRWCNSVLSVLRRSISRRGSSYNYSQSIM